MKRIAIVALLGLAACGGGGGGGSGSQATSITGPAAVVLLGDDQGGSLKTLDLRTGVNHAVIDGLPQYGAAFIETDENNNAYLAGSALTGIMRIDLRTGASESISEYIGTFGGLVITAPGELYWFGSATDSSTFPPSGYGTETYYKEPGPADSPVPSASKFSAAALLPSSGHLLVVQQPNEANGSVTFVEFEATSRTLRRLSSSTYSDASYASYRDIAISRLDESIVYVTGGGDRTILKITRGTTPKVEPLNVLGLGSNDEIRHIALESGERTALFTTKSGLYRVDLASGKSAKLVSAVDIGSQAISDVVILQ